MVLGEIVCCLPDKNKIRFRLDLQLLLLRGSRPTMYSECSRCNPNRFTFGGVIVERVNTAKTRRKVNPIFG